MTSAWDLGGLLGRPRSELAERLGAPETERRAGGDVWLRFAREGASLRVRCEAGAGDEEPTVASWTATFASGRSSLRAAAGDLGLWPAAAPDADPTGSAPLIRRPLEAPDGARVHSLTATVRGGRIVQVTAFDEPPDWL